MERQTDVPHETATNSKQQRRNLRTPFDEEIQFLGPQPCVGRSVDLAPGGIGVEVPVRFEPESVVEMMIFGGHLIVFGFVRWVEETAEGFRTGIQFRDEDWGIIKRVQAIHAEER